MGVRFITVSLAVLIFIATIVLPSFGVNANEKFANDKFANDKFKGEKFKKIFVIKKPIFSNEDVVTSRTETKPTICIQYNNVCKKGYMYSNKQDQCTRKQAKYELPVHECTKDLKWDQKSGRCIGMRIKKGKAKMECEAGATYDVVSNRCVKVVKKYSQPKRVCEFGFSLEVASGQCIRSEKYYKKAVVKCKPGFEYRMKENRCVYVEHQSEKPSKVCIKRSCEKGYEFDVVKNICFRRIVTKKQPKHLMKCKRMKQELEKLMKQCPVSKYDKSQQFFGGGDKFSPRFK